MDRRKSMKKNLIGVTLAVLAGLLAGCASTPPITGGDGAAVPGSIASLEKVTLNGRAEWITLRGRDATRPLLLWLAGGPGCSELTMVRNLLGGLEDRFVVAVWDQPGAGKSFRAMPRKKITAETYIEDASALLDLLCARFGREQAYVVGESWGSALALMVAARRPDRVKAVFGTGQMVAFLENDIGCYDLMLAWARELGDTRKVQTLERQGPPPYIGRGVAGKQAAYLMDTFTYMREVSGVHTHGDTIKDIMSPEYTLRDKVSWFRGLIDAMNWVYPRLWDLDLRIAVPRLEMPVIFLVGRHDVNASLPLLEDYCSRLEAPSKELVWFEESGHTPWASETDRFIEELSRRAAP
jgi:pimeloyl-ACP methyl ester carboxylesterase